MTDLTDREKDILNLVGQGQQNKQIAFELNIAENTVKSHMHHIFVKLRASNRVQALLKYQQLQGELQP